MGYLVPLRDAADFMHKYEFLRQMSLVKSRQQRGARHDREVEDIMHNYEVKLELNALLQYHITNS